MCFCLNKIPNILFLTLTSSLILNIKDLGIIFDSKQTFSFYTEITMNKDTSDFVLCRVHILI